MPSVTSSAPLNIGHLNLNNTFCIMMVTGTPGTGKSTLSEQISESTGLDWIDVGKIAKDEKLFEEYDPTYGCHVLNEDRVSFI